MLLLSFKIVFFILLTSISLSFAFRPMDYPKISVLKWMSQASEEEGEWQTDTDYLSRESILITDHGSVFSVSQHILALSLVCNATYPIEWIFHQAEYASDDLHDISVRTSRFATDINNPLTNRFSATLEITGEFNRATGNYTCQSTRNNEMQKSVFIFWEGSSPPYFVLSGKSITAQSADNNTIVLPCYIAQPNTDVFLFKQMNGTFRPVLMGNFIKFDARIGYTINLERSTDTYGLYKCTTDDPDDFVLVSVDPGLLPIKHFENAISPRAGIFFDEEREELVCCSNSEKPPSFHDVFCTHASSCRMHEHKLLKAGNNGRKLINGSCASDKMFPRDSGIVRCKGDGIDVFRYFYTDFSKSKKKHLKMYLNWEDIPPQSMMNIIAHAEYPIYDRQNLTVTCEILSSYFSDGVLWAVKWKNGSLIFVENNEHPDDIRYHGFRNLEITMSLGMEELVCFAPVWNSTAWVNLTLNLDIHESVAPTLSGPLLEEVSLKLNDTEQLIECKSFATPSATLIWRKNNQSIPQSMIIWKKNGTSVLIFHRVSHETQGDYKCIAKNYAGQAEKIIRVFVEDSSSRWGTVAAILIPLMVLVFVSIAGYLVWKMQLQKKVLDHLTRVVFRDVERGTES